MKIVDIFIVKKYYFHLPYSAKYFLSLSKKHIERIGENLYTILRKDYRIMHMERTQQLSLVKLLCYYLPLPFRALFFNKTQWSDAHNRMRAFSLTPVLTEVSRQRTTGCITKNSETARRNHKTVLPTTALPYRDGKGTKRTKANRIH